MKELRNAKYCGSVYTVERNTILNDIPMIEIKRANLNCLGEIHIDKIS